jgi:hypothetical protein
VLGEVLAVIELRDTLEELGRRRFAAGTRIRHGLSGLSRQSLPPRDLFLSKAKNIGYIHDIED